MKEKDNFLNVKVDVRNLECVKDTVRIINNDVYNNNGNISEYNGKLLIALLGENWHKKYEIGKVKINERFRA